MDCVPRTAPPVLQDRETSACSMDEKPCVRKTRWAQPLVLNHRSVVLPSSTNPGQNHRRVRAEDGWQRNAGAQGHGHISPVLLQLLCFRGFCSTAGQAEGTGGWQEPRSLRAGGEQRGGWRGGKQRGGERRSDARARPGSARPQLSASRGVDPTLLAGAGTPRCASATAASRDPPAQVSMESVLLLGREQPGRQYSRGNTDTAFVFQDA